jgi:TfoX/Sxy family transcriptional regulator of competence genes
MTAAADGKEPLMAMPRPDDETRAFFRTVLPDDPAIQTRPMFGNLAAFVNGNMFAGLYGSSTFVRLPPEGRAELLACEGAGPFEPMPGRPMGEYVVLPDAWRADPETAQSWVRRSFQWASRLPVKEKKEKKRS